MKIAKLPSGSYRIRKMYKGKMYSVTTEYKPTQKDALQLMAAELDKVQVKKGHLTFKEASKKYVESKNNVLSPRTVKEYSEMPDRLSKAFVEMVLTDITQEDIQSEINRLAKDKSPKTVRNYHGYISAVLRTYRPDLSIRTTLPQKLKSEPYIPTDDDVRRVLASAEGTPYEIPIILACYGLRRSEICALTPDDIDGDVVTINKALVLNKDKKWVTKITKTTESSRTVIIPHRAADMIKKQGYVYKGHPNSITDYLESVQDKLGMPEFSLHKLRHYFASKMSELKIPEADILKMGGWETDHVMKAVYRHAMMSRDRDAMRDAASKLGNSIFIN
jgi:integrase